MNQQISLALCSAAFGVDGCAGRIITIARNTLVATGLSAIVACGQSTSTSGVVPPAAPCAKGDVVQDVGGTSGFGRQPVVDPGTVELPTDVAFVPGAGSVFVVTSQTGLVHYFNGNCELVNTVDLRDAANGGLGVVDGGEQGLLNVEFHPDYAANGYVFFYHTTVASTVNSVSRMAVSFDASGALVLSDPVRIVDMRKSSSAAASNHNGGGLVFAPDKSLLASVGDGGADSASAQDDARLLGKVIRILPNLTAGAGGYTIPGGNMFPASNPPCSDVVQSGAPCPEILAKGLRNPFRMSIDGNVVYLGDVGTAYEEINSLDYSHNTLNFGWPTHDGPVGSSPLSGYRNPIVAYRRDVEGAEFRAEDPMATATGAASVIIGDVYRGSRYDGVLGGSLLFADFYDGYFRAVGVAPGGDGNGEITDTDGVPGFHVLHVPQLSSVVQGPDGFVYFTTLYSEAMVYRLVRP